MDDNEGTLGSAVTEPGRRAQQTAEEEIPIATQAALIRQDHRLLPVLWNYFYRRRHEFTEKDDPRRAAATWALIWRLAAPSNVVVVGGSIAAAIVAVAGVYVALRANELVKEQNTRLEQQTHLMEASRRVALVPFLLDVINRLDKERADGENVECSADSRLRPCIRDDGLVNLSQALELRIGSLSRSLRPYYSFEPSSQLSDTPLSPERGQLLLAIHSAGVDPAEIYRVGKFRGADLPRADLTGADLSESDLSGANFLLTNLTGANVDNAILSEAYLLWADLTGADLDDASLDDADLTVADLTAAKLRWADLTNANLKGAHLTGADLNRADLSGANLNRADLSGANLSGATVAHLRRWREIRSIRCANISGVEEAPAGFVEWARSQDALEIELDAFAAHDDEEYKAWIETRDSCLAELPDAP